MSASRWCLRHVHTRMRGGYDCQFLLVELDVIINDFEVTKTSPEITNFQSF